MIPKLEDCNPGLSPVGYSVLVALDALEEKTVGGIILPDRHKEREDGACERGLVVSVSPMAFQGGDWGYLQEPPSTGHVVLFQRYAGSEFEGLDGRKYRIINDSDLKGVFA